MNRITTFPMLLPVAQLLVSGCGHDLTAVAETPRCVLDGETTQTHP